MVERSEEGEKEEMWLRGVEVGGVEGVTTTHKNNNNSSLLNQYCSELVTRLNSVFN